MSQLQPKFVLRTSYTVINRETGKVASQECPGGKALNEASKHIIDFTEDNPELLAVKFLMNFFLLIKEVDSPAPIQTLSPEEVKAIRTSVRKVLSELGYDYDTIMNLNVLK